MPKWMTEVRIATSCTALLAVIMVLSGCLGLPTIEITPTTEIKATTLPPTPVATVTSITIKVTGDVYVRDEQGNIIGWLNKGDQVQADCSGDWCRILSGSYTRYLFWRGCSSDNPEHKNCQSR